MDPVAMLSLLDYRAATYERLGELKLALKDGKAMIQREKTNPKVC